jgi:hypothetical protein
LIVAAKLALNMFSHEKSTTSREKDLVRILKVSVAREFNNIIDRKMELIF